MKSYGVEALLGGLLDQAALRADVAWSSYRARWGLLAASLRGLTPVRGGERPRDQPLGRANRAALRLARLLDVEREATVLRLPDRPGEQQGRGVRYRLLDWLVALELVVLTEPVVEDAQERESLYLYAIVAAVRAVEASAVGGGDGTWKSQPIYRMLGLNPNVFNRQGNTLVRDRLGAPATLLAGIANLPLLHVRAEQREEVVKACYGDGSKNARDGAMAALDRLRTRKVTVVTLRPQKVQSFINRCNRHYIKRGASVWCGLALAALRELLTRDEAASPLRRPSVTLIDADVELRLAVAGELAPDEVRAAVERALESFNDDDTPLLTRFPVLAEQMAEARRAGVRLTDAFPELCVRCTATNLLELATDAERWREDYDEPEGELLVPPRTSPLSKAECCERPGDVGVYRDPPPWHEQGQRCEDELYGWPALLFSLVGSTHRMRTQVALAQELGDARLPVWFRRSELQDAARRRGDESGLKVMFAAVDARGVGRSFVETASIRRPGHSLLLATQMRERWLAAVRTAVAAEPWPVLPIDVIYFGGDDITLMGPMSVVERVVAGFIEPAEADGDRLEFAAATIEFDNEQDRALDQRLTEAAVRSLYEALKCAKGNECPEKFAAMLREEYNVPGVNLEREPGEFAARLRVRLAAEEASPHPPLKSPAH